MPTLFPKSAVPTTFICWIVVFAIAAGAVTFNWCYRAYRIYYRDHYTWDYLIPPVFFTLYALAHVLIATLLFQPWVVFLQ